MFKHSKGPWQFEETEDSYFVLRPGHATATIAVIEKGCTAVTLPDEISPEEAKANALLVCGAQELLENSVQFIAWFREFIGEDAYKECLENCPELQKILIAITWSRL